jgi:Tfp pilus assembly protein PilF
MSIYLKTKKLEKQENSLVSSETTATPSSSIPTTLEPIAPRYEQKNTPEVPEDFPPPSDFFSLHQKTLVFIQNKNIIIAIAVVLVLVSGGYTWFNLRANNFLKEGKAALVEKNYSVALESLTQYAEFANPSEEEIILLARAQLMSGNIMQAEKTLRPLSQKFSELPKASYINAAANYGNAPQKAMSLLEKSKYSSYPPVYALLGIFALLENNPVIARDYLEKTVDTLSNTELSVEETQTLNDLLLHSYYFYLQNTDVKIGEKFPLPFDKLKKPMPIDKNLGFAVNTEGFNNYYGIPLNVEALAQQENSTPASDIVALQALSYVIDKNHKQARKIIVESTVASQSLLSQYIIAYLDMADGDTQSAQKHYEEINQRTPSTYSFAYAAGAAWSRQEGNLPNDDILAMYQKATDTDPTNTVALNNYVFLLMYAGNEKKAAELIKQAQKRNLLNNELLALSFLLDISAQRQPETTRVELLDELSNNPESSLLLNAAIVLEKLSGNYAEAATLTRRLQILLPEEPRVVDTLLLVR